MKTLNTNKRIRVLTIFLIVLAVLGGGVALAAYGQYQAIVQSPIKAFIPDKQQESAANAPTETKTAGEASVKSENEQPAEDQVTYNGAAYMPNENVINILLLGIDWDATRKDMGWRSDMNMLCTVDFARNKISLTSIPRDTRTKVYSVNQNNGKIKSSGLDKINAAYSYGGGPDKYGAENAMRCIGEFLSVNGKYDVPVDYYISIDLQGIPKFASALGGIKVKLDVNFPGLGKKGETITLNEENSRAYLENRKEVGGEMVRISHEQQYLMAVAQKIKEKGAVSSAPALYANLMKFMHTNLSLEQILALSKVLDNGSMDDITLQTLTGDFAYINDISYFIADTKDVESKTVSLMYTSVSGDAQPSTEPT